MDKRPIGVFDSGIGGLTVVKEITQLLPNEDIVYFGDTARVPYGSKSRETVTKYAFSCIKFLLQKDVKAIVIACNTASASSLDAAKQSFDIPIIGVVEPGALAACNMTKKNKIGIIGTEGTVNSGAYEKAINKINDNVKMHMRSCPLFVPIVEEGWQDSDIAYLTASRYLDDLKDFDIDALVLACTHYPLLQNTISKTINNSITLVNPALETAKALRLMLIDRELQSDKKESGKCTYFVSDNPVKFKSVGENFLKKAIPYVEKIDIEKY